MTTLTYTHHAILIGVGITIDPAVADSGGKQTPNNRSLTGTTADIDAVEEYLKEDHHVKVTRLTATSSDGASGRAIPKEKPSDLSTLDNVRKALQRLIEHGEREGIKHVYIHFSGHGIRSSGTEILCLEMYDHSPDGDCQMDGDELVKNLNALTKIGITVMLVLDCCFSGSVKRGENNRFLEYDNGVDKDSVSNDKTRDSMLETKKLLKPRDYMVLTACSPDETTREIALSDGIQRGALSHYLVRSLWHLRKSRAQVTFETLFRHLQTTFHAEHPVQTPMRYGSANTCFFQHVIPIKYDPYIPAFLHPQSQRLLLHAGAAHGVHKGDEYWVYPFFISETEDPMPQSRRIKVAVETVYAFKSDVVITNASVGEAFTRAKTWKALPTTTASMNKIRIQILSSVKEADRDYLHREMSSMPYCEPCQPGETSIYTIGVNNEGMYRIHHGERREIQQSSSLSKDSDLPLHRIVNVLSHLGAYKFFEGIKCEASGEFKKMFSIDVSGEVGSDGWYEVQDKCTWKLTIRNKETHKLYFSVFNLQSSWQVENVSRGVGDDDYDSIGPGASIELPFTMELPGTGDHVTEDIMKVFVMSRQVSFPGAILPELGTHWMRDSSDQLSMFVDSLTTGLFRDEDLSKDNWATESYMVRTRRAG
ncbi:hypothetical protein FPSE5266_20280 [Fusarium pseudograminearum]|nr:hypothetical protein FPSE5266_20280 [Fusarium pseudograminearum]